MTACDGVDDDDDAVYDDNGDFPRKGRNRQVAMNILLVP